MRSVYDWKCVFLGSSTNPENNVMDSNSGSARGFFLGMGRQKVFKLTPSNRGGYAWMPFNLAKFELASGTLLYGEVVEEKRGEARSMRRVMAFHVIGLVTNSIFSVCFLLLTSKTEVLQLPSAIYVNL